MQTSEYSVDLSVFPWVTPPMYVNYSLTDSARIEAGVRAMLTEPGASDALLIPLAPLPNGTRYFAAAIRDLGDVQHVVMAQYPLPRVSFACMRALETPETVRAAFPHIRFTVGCLGRVDNQRLFWNVLREQSELVYATITQHIVVGGMGLGYDILARSMYGMAMASRVEIALREVCGGVRTVLLVYDPEDEHHFMAILRNGTTIKLVDVQVVPQIVPFERMVIFQPQMAQMFPGFQFTSIQPQMAQMFPGFQFTSTRFTDAEKEVVYLAPVLQHYQILNDTHYRHPQLTAVAMSLHPRLGSAVANHIGSLGCDVLAKIANMML